MKNKLEFNDKGILYQSGKGEILLAWPQVQGLYQPVFGSTPYIRAHGHPKIRLNYTEQEMGPVILNFYKHWNEKFPYLTKKNAFDYSEHQASGAILMLSISILFCFVLSGALLVEAASVRECSRLMASNAVVQPAEILKLSKRQQGNLMATLQFTTAAGDVIKGKRNTMRKYEKTDPDPKEISVIYPPEKPSCWELSEEFGKNDLNWAKRRFTTAFNILVGLSFAIVGAFGTIVAIIRLRQKRPFAEEVAKQFRMDT